jgi:streptogramin lyase
LVDLYRKSLPTIFNSSIAGACFTMRLFSRRFASLLLLAAAISSTAAVGAAEVEVLIGPPEPVPPASANSVLVEPFAMEFDAEGTMVIVEYTGGRVMTWSQDAGLKHIAGGPEQGYVDGKALDARFNKLHNLVILPSGKIILSEHLNHTIRQYDPQEKTISTFSGNGKQGPAVPKVAVDVATFNQPICVMASPDYSSLLVADIGNHVIRRVDMASGLVTIVAGNGKRGTPVDGAMASESPLVDPRGAIETAEGEMYVISRGGHMLWKIDREGKIVRVAGNGKAGLVDGGVNESQLNGPKHLCFGPSGEIYLADDVNDAVRKFDPKTGLLSTVDLGDYKIKRPHGVTVRDGWLYIADSFQHRILRVKL